MKLKSLSIALATLGMGFAASAQAVLLMPGSGPLGVDIIAAPGGTLLAQRSEAVTTSHWSGTFRTAVVDGPEAGVNLDFYYQLTNNASSADSLSRMTGSDFANSITTNLVQSPGATTLTGTGGVGSISFLAGNQIATSGDRGTLGVVGMNFLPGGGGKIDPGETSYTMIVRTNATAFTTGTTGLTNGTATTVTSYMPSVVAPIPEPGTLALLASGLLAAGGVARRRIK